MTATYHPTAHLELDVFQFGSRSKKVVLQPKVIEARLTRNHHLAADELTVTIPWLEGGVDPRTVKNARCGFWFWDDNYEVFNANKHLRFTGIATKVSRRLDSSGWVVDLTFEDYTTLFIANKPLKTSGMPEWSDSLVGAWQRICDNTGWYDPEAEKIVSSVEALRNNLVYQADYLSTRTIGEIENARFHKLSKPTPKRGASSWDVWQWIIGSLGLISYIDKDELIVTNNQEHYSTENAPRAIYAHTIYEFEEAVDSSISQKGVLLKSFDPIAGKVLEAFYPPPGDERLKARRAAVKKKSEEGEVVTANEQSADYEEFTNWSIRTQKALEEAARAGYEERARQEVKGSFKTQLLRIHNRLGQELDILSLRAGETISIEMDPERDPEIRDTLLRLGSEAAQIDYLRDRLDYDEGLARLIAQNLEDEKLASLLYHIETVELDYGPDRCEVTVKYHNIINID